MEKIAKISSNKEEKENNKNVSNESNNILIEDKGKIKKKKKEFLKNSKKGKEIKVLVHQVIHLIHQIHPRSQVHLGLEVVRTKIAIIVERLKIRKNTKRKKVNTLKRVKKTKKVLKNQNGPLLTQVDLLLLQSIVLLKEKQTISFFRENNFASIRKK